VLDIFYIACISKETIQNTLYSLEIWGYETVSSHYYYQEYKTLYDCIMYYRIQAIPIRAINVIYTINLFERTAMDVTNFKNIPLAEHVYTIL
jgi:hypothetical protein